MVPYRQGRTAAEDAFKLSSNENPFPPLPAVLEAIEARDVGEARHRMVDHVVSAGELVVRRFEERAA